MDTLCNGCCFCQHAFAIRAQRVGSASVPYGDRCDTGTFSFRRARAYEQRVQPYSKMYWCICDSYIGNSCCHGWRLTGSYAASVVFVGVCVCVSGLWPQFDWEMWNDKEHT